MKLMSKHSVGNQSLLRIHDSDRSAASRERNGCLSKKNDWEAYMVVEEGIGQCQDLDYGKVAYGKVKSKK